jgi:hypothetical protein
VSTFLILLMGFVFVTSINSDGHFYQKIMLILSNF